jgi:hypothetical protein
MANFHGSGAEATLALAHGIEDLLPVCELPDPKNIQTARNRCN